MSRRVAHAAARLLAIAAIAAIAQAQAASGSYTASAADGHIDFTGVQAGAEFKGTFHTFAVAVEFAPETLSSAHFDVLIELNSLDTKDGDRDKTLRGSDLFDVSKYPTAHYVARSFTKTATGYAAIGALTLHGITKDVPINFQFSASPGAKLEGTASVKRLDFGVGVGDWKSTEWVGDVVKVGFSLALKAKT